MEPNFRALEDCGGDRRTCKADGCPLFGKLRKSGKVAGCQDLGSRNGSNRVVGLNRQEVARKLLKVKSAKHRGRNGNEESWNSRGRYEVKAGGQVEVVATKFLEMEEQSNAQVAIGDPRPFIGVLMPEGWGKDGIVMLRLSAWSKEFAFDMEGL